MNIYGSEIARNSRPNIRMQQHYGVASANKQRLESYTNDIFKKPLAGELFIEVIEGQDEDLGSDIVDLSDIDFTEVISYKTSEIPSFDNETVVSPQKYSVIISSAAGAGTTIVTPNLLPIFSSSTVAEDGYNTYKAIFRHEYKDAQGNIAYNTLTTPNLLPHATVKSTAEWNAYAEVPGKGEICLEIEGD